MTGFELLIFENKVNEKGMISIIYKDLGKKMWDIPVAFQKAWDKDCPTADITMRWVKIWSSYLCKSKSHYIRLQHFKILSRWYMTQVKLYHMKVKNDTECWKGCGQNGSFF